MMATTGTCSTEQIDPANAVIKLQQILGNNTAKKAEEEVSNLFKQLQASILVPGKITKPTSMDWANAITDMTNKRNANNDTQTQQVIDLITKVTGYTFDVLPEYSTHETMKDEKGLPTNSRTRSFSERPVSPLPVATEATEVGKGGGGGKTEAVHRMANLSLPQLYEQIGKLKNAYLMLGALLRDRSTTDRRTRVSLRTNSGEVLAYIKSTVDAICDQIETDSPISKKLFELYPSILLKIHENKYPLIQTSPFDPDRPDEFTAWVSDNEEHKLDRFPTYDDSAFRSYLNNLDPTSGWPRVFVSRRGAKLYMPPARCKASCLGTFVRDCSFEDFVKYMSRPLRNLKGGEIISTHGSIDFPCSQIRVEEKPKYFQHLPTEQLQNMYERLQHSASSSSPREE